MVVKFQNLAKYMVLQCSPNPTICPKIELCVTTRGTVPNIGWVNKNGWHADEKRTSPLLQSHEMSQLALCALDDFTVQVFHGHLQAFPRSEAEIPTNELDNFPPYLALGVLWLEIGYFHGLEAIGI